MNTGPSAENVIHLEYGRSRNFMTPEILAYGWVVPGKVAYELSRGESMISHVIIYGLSMARLNYDGTTTRLTDLSRMFYSITAAEVYIETAKYLLDLERR